MDSTRIENLWRWLGFFNAIAIPSVGIARGLCLIASSIAKNIILDLIHLRGQDEGRDLGMYRRPCILSLEEKIEGSSF
ncbi:LOW QUALITY PROTEIN: hypothetical protein PanWU01x14_240220 [Parasponia andersonii]|uniref:Uncharacterized protein n=1 Tax=Parasponia andersonii TaxID=3476 RepID=A0A2P5BGW3_PARAD|nr:LOW QUALITY PROTEIN: hypothetical protein PanWU01x14_240220 [Parasponia andersonii]